jgi:hypothetical protein
MDDNDDAVTQISKLRAQADAIEVELSLDPKRIESSTLAAGKIAAVPFLVELGAIAVKSELHPEWVSVDFPLAEASGMRALAIKYIISMCLGGGAQPGFKMEGTSKVFMKNRVYFNINKMDEGIEAIRRAMLTQKQRDGEDNLGVA